METRGLWEDFLCGSSLFSFQRMTFLSCFTFQAGSGNRPIMIKTRNGNITARALPQRFGVLTQSQTVVRYSLINLNNWKNSTFRSGKLDHSLFSFENSVYSCIFCNISLLQIIGFWEQNLCWWKKKKILLFLVPSLTVDSWNKNHLCVSGGLFGPAAIW